MQADGFQPGGLAQLTRTPGSNSGAAKRIWQAPNIPEDQKSRADGAQRSLAGSNMMRHLETQLQTGANKPTFSPALPPSPWQANGISGELRK